jgi:O-antigen ligase
MAVAVFVEAYNLISSATGRWWRAGLMVLYITLLFLARSVTAAAAATLYVAGAIGYLIWRRWHWRGLAAAAMSSAVLLLAFLLLTPEPMGTLAFVGKDSTLTGRVYLWHEVVKLIGERPVLGWGYRAMWQPGDQITRVLDSYAGFEAPGAHSAVLEIALGVGWLGVLAMGGNVLVALRRGLRCCRGYSNLLGWFTCMFVLGTAASGITNEVMGMNQEIDWLVFSALIIACGISLPNNSGLSCS